MKYLPHQTTFCRVIAYISYRSSAIITTRSTDSIMPYLKVTLVRSGKFARQIEALWRLTLAAIGLPKKTNLVLESLGLRKRMQSVFHTVSPQTAGMVLKVKELVKVEEVAGRQTIQQIRAQRRPASGFEVTGNLLRRPASP